MLGVYVVYIGGIYMYNGCVHRCKYGTCLPFNTMYSLDPFSETSTSMVPASTSLGKSPDTTPCAVHTVRSVAVDRTFTEDSTVSQNGKNKEDV